MKIDRIVHSRRKTIALVIEPDGSLTVRAPLRTSRSLIEQLVQDKAAWIQEKQAWIQSHPSLPYQKSFTNGELFFFLGDQFPLEVVSSHSPVLQLDDGRFLLDRRALPRAEKVFTNWYRRQARQVIGARLPAIAGELGFSYRSLRISSARRRWGSCGAKGTLNFSWRLVMAPLPVIDYVILHELVHLEIRNHSRLFWERLGQLMPDYKQRVAWLKANGRLLSL